MRVMTPNVVPAKFAMPAAPSHECSTGRSPPLVKAELSSVKRGTSSSSALNRGAMRICALDPALDVPPQDVITRDGAGYAYPVPLQRELILADEVNTKAMVERVLRVVGGLGVFGFAFAVNSSVHSYLILAYAGSEKAAEDVGFYYAANALGRFCGTLLSGLLYQWGGLMAALLGSGLMLLACWLVTLNLPLRLELASPAARTES